MSEYRVRLTDDRLRFLIVVLKQISESNEELLHFYKQLKKAHEKDWDRTEFRKANTAYSETKQKQIATLDMIRRFEANSLRRKTAKQKMG